MICDYTIYPYAHSIFLGKSFEILIVESKEWWKIPTIYLFSKTKQNEKSAHSLKKGKK